MYERIINYFPSKMDKYDASHTNGIKHVRFGCVIYFSDIEYFLSSVVLCLKSSVNLSTQRKYQLESNLDVGVRPNFKCQINGFASSFAQLV